ncbi:MAG: glycosyltransferase [Candidatus Omnitrophica bacterium]|nr:glycosyltransferase [Candidatus Omnitrophota bacterium]
MKIARKLTQWVLRRAVREGRRRRSGTIALGICHNHRISRFSPFMQVAGDEWLAVRLGEELFAHCPEIRSWRFYDAKDASRLQADLLIVMSPDYPLPPGSRSRRVMWLGFAGWANRIPQLLERYETIFCASARPCAQHRQVIYLPVPCEDERLFRPVPPDARLRCEVSFLGNYFRGSRPPELLTRYVLPATSFRFGIWGCEWEQAEPPALRAFARGRLPARLGPSLYASSHICLSIHGFFHHEEDNMVSRPLSILACEAFVISDYLPSLTCLKDYVVFTEGGKDLEEKIRYYLAHPEERAAKVRGARQFILQHHTMAHRAKIMAEKLGLEWKDIGDGR